MATWQPLPEGVKQVVDFIHLATRFPQHTDQIAQKLLEFNKISDFNCYLMLLFGSMPELEVDMRVMAGILLKNNLRDGWATIADAVKHYVLSQIVSQLASPHEQVRYTTGSIITTIFAKTKSTGWPDVIPQLCVAVDNENPAIADGAFFTLEKICEDHSVILEEDEVHRPLSVLIPRLIAALRSPNERIRTYGLSCILYFIPDKPPALLVHVDTLLEAIFFLALNDTSVKIRQRVCYAFSALVDGRYPQLGPSLSNIVQYMIALTRDTNPTVSLAASEFWNSIAEAEHCREAVGPFLPQLIAVLVNSLRFSEIELINNNADSPEGTSHIPDSEQEIRPLLLKGRKHVNTGDDSEETEHSLRRVCAAALDGLSYVFDKALLEVLLPIVQTKLNSQDWLDRESSILALGAVAAGCVGAMETHLPTLLPYLATQLKDGKFLIRSITCWTLSKYAEWFIKYDNPTAYFEPIIKSILPHVLDQNKQVQEAACSALAIITETAGADAAPYLPIILPVYLQAFQSFQVKASFVLCDTIGTLVKSVGQEFIPCLDSLMPIITQRWNSIDDANIFLLPLMELFSAVCVSIGMAFVPFALPVYTRLIRLLENYMVHWAAHQDNKHKIDPPDERFAVVSLDMVSAMCEALGASVDSLIANSTLIQLLVQLAANPNPEVKQAAFALIGDLTRFCTVHIAPVVHKLLPIMIPQIRPRIAYVSVPNNATWAVGEICLKGGQQMEPYALEILQRTLEIQKDPYLHRHLQENAAITLGRLGLACPGVLAPHMNQFFKTWCISLARIQDDNTDEKESAFRGLCLLVKTNPMGALDDLYYLCDAIASWFFENLPKDLREDFRNILHEFKRQLGGNWDAAFIKFPDYLKKSLRQYYSM